MSTPVARPPAPREPEQIARDFPLLPRPRPPAQPLPARLTEITTLTHATHTGPARGRLRAAAEALNKAALIASDCGHADLARHWCWQQFDALTHLGPHPDLSCTAVLQPLVNLGRLDARAGNPDTAYYAYQALYHAITERRTTQIGGHTIDLSPFLADAAAQRELRKFAWSVLLADGTRALTHAGHWETALQQLNRYHGIGARLLDGRQTAILTHALRGDLPSATSLLTTSTTLEPWEHATAACLHVLIHAQHHHSTDTTPMLTTYLALPATPATIAFHVTLGLAIAELTTTTADAHRVLTHVIDLTRRNPDARISRQLLHHPRARLAMSGCDTRDAYALIHAANLDSPGGEQEHRYLRDLRANAAIALNYIHRYANCVE